MDKQAVVIIHGVGEQKPMQTLRGFVEAVWTQDESIHNPHGLSDVWSKPDDVSGNFELRRLTTGKNRDGIRTDFFEFYWAHLMHGTTLTHVIGWARFLLMRKPGDVPDALKGVYWFLLGSLTLAGFFAINAAMSEDIRLIGIPAWVSLLFSVLIIPSAGQIIKTVVGDAARYLYPAPPNIQRRHEIRHAGVEMLRDLHNRNYSRIVVVGHSLGTVIGYDILKFYWAEVHRSLDPSKHLKYTCLRKLEKLAASNTKTIGEIRAAQVAYYDELVANGHHWRVSDFVTLGSPLAHADILLANDEADRLEKQRLRELPTCPPTLEISKGEKSGFSFAYPATYLADGVVKKKKVTFPHHAAVFAPTRWTNIYFKPEGIIKGDIISGPLQPVFGSGILDVPVQTAQRDGYLSHTLYWSVGTWAAKPEQHIKELRDAIALA